MLRFDRKQQNSVKQLSFYMVLCVCVCVCVCVYLHLYVKFQFLKIQIRWDTYPQESKIKQTCSDQQ